MPKAKSGKKIKKICDAALKTAARHGWLNLTYEMLAKTAKTSPREIKELFPTLNALLPAIVLEIDEAVAKAVGKSLRGSPHDRLFEIMMARFDILQTHRAAILSIIHATKQTPSLATHLLPAQMQAMRKALRLGRVTLSEREEVLASLGLLLIYGATLSIWMRDETKDLAKTMAALDRTLRRTSKLMDILFRLRGSF